MEDLEDEAAVGDAELDHGDGVVGVGGDVGAPLDVEAGGDLAAGVEAEGFGDPPVDEGRI